jgi:hypothetical protein
MCPAAALAKPANARDRWKHADFHRSHSKNNTGTLKDA